MKESEAEYYEVDSKTNAVWRLLDGKRTVQEIVDEAKRSDETVTDEEVKEVIVSLAEEGVIESTEPEVQHRRVELISALQIDVHLLKDSSKSLAGFFKVTKRLINGKELWLALGITVLGFALFFSSFLQIFSHPSVFNVAGSAILGFFFYQLFLLLPVYAVHELAHAAVCDYYGGRPREIGTGLYYLAPFFYCDTSDSWRLSRHARIMISVAGPLSTLVIASFLVFGSYLLPPGYPQDVLKIGAFFGFYGTLTNFSPVIETDGYYILADVLNIMNLRDETFSYIKRGFLKVIGRSAPAVRRSARQRKIIAIYTVITVAWLAFFGYTTVWLLGVYGQNAYSAVIGISSVLLRTQPLSLTAMGVNVATLAYFGLTIAGFAVMGIVASKNIRMKGVKLETIHDKRVSVFLPLPSSVQRSTGSGLVADAKKTSASFSRSYSVTLEPPLCVAALRLGKVDQSLEAMRGEMQKVEQSFRSIHSEFLSRYLRSAQASAKTRLMGENLVRLAGQLSPIESKSAISATQHFLKNQDENVRFLLESAFGTVWTLELSPDDYRRLRREIFPSLVAEDLGGADLPGEVEQFKKQAVVGTDVIAQLSEEVEAESKEVYRRPEVYQITAFLEPIKSRLVFVGRTTKVAGSVSWLGGLYLYEAWASYVGEQLQDSAVGLKAMRLAQRTSLTKTQAAKMQDGELKLLDKDLLNIEALAKSIEDLMPRIESTYESAVNFHETLESLVSDEAFDIGLYKPILSINSRHLQGVRDEIDSFHAEFGRVYKKLAADATVVRQELSNRTTTAGSTGKNWFRRLGESFSSRLSGSRGRSPAFDAEVRLMLATTRLAYGVVAVGDMVL